MALISKEERGYMDSLGPALYSEVLASIQSKKTTIVFFINYSLSEGAIEYYKGMNLHIRLMPFTYKQGRALITIWKQAIVMN